MICCAKIEFDMAGAWCYRLIKQFISIPIKPNPLQKGAECNGSFEGEDSRAAEGYVFGVHGFFIYGQMKLCSLPGMMSGKLGRKRR
jgi:hypothetical protein